MYTLINGSFKTQKSNSRTFLEYISKYLNNYQIYDLKNDSYNTIIDNIDKSDTIILAFPLYVDSPNAPTIQFLNYLIDHNINLVNKNIYLVINCGFREGINNVIAANIIKNWCVKVGATYCGSILIGAGEIVGKTRYKLICTKALKQLKHFSISIKNKQKTNDIITTMDLLNNYIYCKLANKSWKKQMKNNLIYKHEK